MSNFLNTKGEAQLSNVSFAKFGMGSTQIRLVGDVLPGYAYWIKNSIGKDKKVDNLAFNPVTERWDSGQPDVVKEFGFTERNEKGETVPMKSKRNYQIQIINRASGKLEVMSLSKAMFDSIVAYCRDTGVSDVSSLELFIEKTGDQARWNSIRYNLNQVKTMQFNSQPAKVEEARAKDEEILKDVKDIRELFPRPTPDELRTQIQTFLAAQPEDSAQQSQQKPDSSAAEALNELD